MNYGLRHGLFFCLHLYLYIIDKALPDLPKLLRILLLPRIIPPHIRLNIHDTVLLHISRVPIQLLHLHNLLNNIPPINGLNLLLNLNFLFGRCLLLQLLQLLLELLAFLLNLFLVDFEFPQLLVLEWGETYDLLGFGLVFAW